MLVPTGVAAPNGAKTDTLAGYRPTGPWDESPKSLNTVRTPVPGSTRNSTPGPTPDIGPDPSATRIEPEVSTATPYGSPPRGPCIESRKLLSNVRAPVPGSTRNNAPSGVSEHGSPT